MRVLVVEDEDNIRESLCRYLTMKGLPAVSATNGLSAQRVLQEGGISAAVVDLRMPGLDGIGLLQWIKAERLRVPVIMISAFGEIGDAVTAMKQGAADYLVKPFDSELLVGRLRDCLAEEDFRAHLELASAADTGLDFVGQSPAAQKIREIIRLAADTPSTVLITGESGTGKEIVARLLHVSSSRRDGPFVAVNVGGLPETLLESELFGYEKGAFTGADDRRLGTIERAAGGTLFLDEIGDMALPLQVKILRVLQDMKVQRLGGTHGIPVDARVVAATNTNLEQRVRGGLFREDLFYRLNVVRIDIPPLRERVDDIPLLTASILVRLRKKLGKRVEGISARALELLKRHAFLGNVRELENTLERTCLFMDGPTIDAESLDLGSVRSTPGYRPADKDAPRGSATLEDLERKAITAALQRWDGNRTKAAAELGISRRTLFNKLKAFGISFTHTDRT
jgi:two-component system, NtrC family, response regulator AtoC